MAYEKTQTDIAEMISWNYSLSAATTLWPPYLWKQSKKSSVPERVSCVYSLKIFTLWIGRKRRKEKEGIPKSSEPTCKRTLKSHDQRTGRACITTSENKESLYFCYFFCWCCSAFYYFFIFFCWYFWPQQNWFLYQKKWFRIWKQTRSNPGLENQMTDELIKPRTYVCSSLSPLYICALNQFPIINLKNRSGVADRKLERQRERERVGSARVSSWDLWVVGVEYKESCGYTMQDKGCIFAMKCLLLGKFKFLKFVSVHTDFKN